MRVGKDDSDFLGNAILAAFAIALVCYLGWAVDHAGKSANLSHSYASAAK